ncbi:hypothetical protein PTKIN_Ptkin03bG0225000 [Pterospermum kingtungense]
MMVFPSSFVSQEEIKLFHTVDRKLYTVLVINLWRDPVESIQVIALLWLWLERVGFGNVVQKTLPLPNLWFKFNRVYLKWGLVGVMWDFFGPKENEAPPDDRTIFLTFSKGYPVYEWEVTEFFTGAYRDCIESLHMQEVMPNEQALFAQIVCHSASAIETILNGRNKAKFTINRKHVWARKFVPKHLKPSPVEPATNLPVSFVL